ncbi:hypothetical protein MKW92_025226, partial [Papaver armeniacum]
VAVTTSIMWHPQDANRLKMLGVVTGDTDEEDVDNEHGLNNENKDLDMELGLNQERAHISATDPYTTSSFQDNGLLKQLETNVAELSQHIQDIVPEVSDLKESLYKHTKISKSILSMLKML